MDPAEVKHELDTNRESIHRLRESVQAIALGAQQTQQVVPQIFAKLDSLKDMMHEHENKAEINRGEIAKDTEALRGDVKLIGEKTSAAMLLVGVKMDAADKATDAKVDEHLASHKKWFPIIPALVVSFVVAVAGAIFLLIKKG